MFKHLKQANITLLNLKRFTERRINDSAILWGNVNNPSSKNFKYSFLTSQKMRKFEDNSLIFTMSWSLIFDRKLKI